MKLQSALAALCLTLTVALVATTCGRQVTAQPRQEPQRQPWIDVERWRANNARLFGHLRDR